MTSVWSLGRDWSDEEEEDERRRSATIGNSRKKIREVEIPNNNGRMFVFVIDLANLVYWVGFITGITFTVHLRIVDFIYICDL